MENDDLVKVFQDYVQTSLEHVGILESDGIVSKNAKKLAEEQDKLLLEYLKRCGLDLYGLNMDNAKYYKQALALNGYELMVEYEPMRVDEYKVKQNVRFILKKDGVLIQPK